MKRFSTLTLAVAVLAIFSPVAVLAQDDAGPLAPSQTPTPNAQAGELFASGPALAATTAADPGAAGPLAVSRAEYNFGATAMRIPNFPGPVELTASVHFPATLETGKTYPMAVFLHGMHATTTDGSRAYVQWPPSSGRVSIPNYRGYDYLARHLASWGYVAVSISANGINARNNEVNDLGMSARAYLVQKHLDLWKIYHTQGGSPFGTRFKGKLDLARIGTMGHSRGGEGVVFHYRYNAQLGRPYGIKAVLPLAPTNFHRAVINNVPLGVLLPYCDGDVSDLQGVHYFDDARYNVRGDASNKHTFLVMGANHNFYNTAWSPSSGIPGASDDWFANIAGAANDPVFGSFAGSRKLTESQQRAGGLTYMTGFFRAYLANRTEFLPMLKGAAAPPPSAASNRIYASYHGPDNTSLRRDLNRLWDNTNLTRNTLGGPVAKANLSPYVMVGGPNAPYRYILGNSPQEPHQKTAAKAPNVYGVNQLVTGWSSASGAYRNSIPAGYTDLRRYAVLQFRAGVNFTDARNSGASAQDFTVTLADGAGRRATVAVSHYSGSLFTPPGNTRGVLPKLLLTTTRVPLSAFGSAVSLADVRSVQFNFNRTTRGGMMLSDLCFSN